MKVRFVPQNVEFDIQPNQSVMNLAQDNGLYIKSVCKGIPNCAECRVRIVEGEHNVLPPSSAELALIGTAYFVDRRRLSCQLRCFGNVTVDLNEQEEKRVSQGKRPRGKGPRDASESFAVRGNMIDERAPQKPIAPPQQAQTPNAEGEEELEAEENQASEAQPGENQQPGEAGGQRRRRRRRRRRK
jgi:ferredoxin